MSGLKWLKLSDFIGFGLILQSTLDEKKGITLLFFCFLGLRSWHIQLPRLGVKLVLQLWAYDTATATQDPSCVCNLNQSSWQCWIPNPLSKVRDQTRILTDTIQIHFHCAAKGALSPCYFMLHFSDMHLNLHVKLTFCSFIFQIVCLFFY